MSANCPSLAIANWPISAWIVRTSRALPPVPTTADALSRLPNGYRPPRCGRCRIQPSNPIPLGLKTRYPCAMTGPQSSSEPVHIVGAGLAGSEAAWQAANAGIRVVLHEMRPHRMTEAHRTDGLAELVCSNSFRSDDAANNAVGLLHAEMRRLGSLVMRAPDANQVPAGGALAVDRDGFSLSVTKALHEHPLIDVKRNEVAGLPPEEWRNVIVATGPLTSALLADAIRTLTDET